MNKCIKSRTGFRVVWEHYRSSDVFVGDLWDTRSDAEYVAEALRGSGYCLNVKVVPW